jgi:hypothetical protein
MAPLSRPAGEDLRHGLAARVGADVRALAALRIGLGTVLLLDLALRARSLVAFYTDAGVLPRPLLAEQYPVVHRLSIHALSGQAWMQALLFVVAGLADLALVVGYRTRLATVVSLLLLVSLHARNPTVLNAGDVLLRRLLFWSIFLPLGARWSLDARVREFDRTRVATFATAGLLLQVVLVYVSNAVFKLRGDRWIRGEAVESVLALDGYSALLGPHLAEVPALLAALTWTWFALVTLSWLLVALTGWPRGLLALLFAAMHAGMALTIDLGVFPLVSIVALLPFLPATVWHSVETGRVPPARFGVARRFDFRPPEVTPRLSGWYRRFRSTLLGVLVVLVVLWNAVALGFVTAPEGTPSEVTERSWNMFGRPPVAETWTVAPGTLSSGRSVDALRGGPVSLDRPPDESRFPRARWRKHLSRYTDRPALTPALAEHLCERWNRTHEDSLVSVGVKRVRAPVDGSAVEPRRTVLLESTRC